MEINYLTSDHYYIHVLIPNIWIAVSLGLVNELK